MFLKYILLITIFTFKITYSQQENNTLRIVGYNMTVHILGYNKTDVRFSLPSVSSSLILNITVNSSQTCFIQCKKQHNNTCKSYVFKINESGENCFLYNRNFNISREITQKDHSYLIQLLELPVIAKKYPTTSNYFLILCSVGRPVNRLMAI